MDAFAHDLSTTDLHPIDLAETLAAHRDWDFDRVGDDQIAVAIEGAWRSYSLSLSWHGHEDMLSLLCTYEMDPPRKRLAELYRTLNLAADQIWGGGFVLWRDHKLMAYRHGMTLAGGGSATVGQMDAMMRDAVECCERFYPAFQLVCWGEQRAEEALEIAIARAYGRA